MKKILSSIILSASLLFAQPANANDMDAVKAFYNDLLSKTTTITQEQVSEVVVEDWVSIPTPKGGKGAKGFYKTLKFFGGIVPDLKWDVQEILKVDNNRYVVRSIATGTPATEEFLGAKVNPGSKFEIMTIDIHTVENGKIVTSYHVEDWLGAVNQVSGKKK